MTLFSVAFNKIVKISVEYLLKYEVHLFVITDFQRVKINLYYLLDLRVGKLLI